MWRVTVPDGDIAQEVHRARRSPLQVSRSDEPALPPTACWAIGQELPSLHDQHRTRITCVDLRSGEVTWTSAELTATTRVRHDAEGTLVTLRLNADEAAAVRIGREPVTALDLGSSRFDASDGYLWSILGSSWQRIAASLDEVPRGARRATPEAALERYPAAGGG